MGEMRNNTPFTITKFGIGGNGKHSKVELRICRFNLCIVSNVGCRSSNIIRDTFSLVLSDLKREAGKVDGRAEGEAGREEDGEEEVAAVLGAAEALVRAVPRALGAPDPLGLPDDVIPHHLKRKQVEDDDRMLEMEHRTRFLNADDAVCDCGCVELLSCGLRPSLSPDYL